MEMINGMPRRNRTDLHEPAESAITQAMMEVESLGASTLLTDAVLLLEQARNKVSDHIESHRLKESPAS